MRLLSRAVLVPLLALGVALTATVGLSLASAGEVVAPPTPPESSHPPAPVASIGGGSVRLPRPGISGSIAAEPQLVYLDGDGAAEVAFGTTSGFYIVGKDGIEQHIGPLAPVSEFVSITDISNDGTNDFVVTVSDTQFPNIRAYDTVTGEEIWSYRPAQVTFANNLMWTNQQTLTFDLSVDDLDGNGVEEVLATSGYRLYALDASNGELRWHYEWRDNVWKSAPVADFTGDGIRDVLVGSQDGYLIGVNGESGEESWKTHLTDDYKAFDENGSPTMDIPQGIWDIVPLPSGDEVVVTSEDGFVRLVSTANGRVNWEHQHIDQVDAARSMYYNQKAWQPTSPGDLHFFNLRAQVVPDATKDGRDNLLVTSYLGAGRMEDPRQATLFILDISTGAQIWKKQIANIALSKKLAVFEYAGEHYVIVPGSDFVALKLADGRPADSKLLDSLGLSTGFEQDSGYSLISLEPDGSVVMSDSGDILWNQNGAQRRIPRTTRNRLLRVDLVGDEVPDVLVIAGSGGTNFGMEPRDRLIYVLDGSTGLLAWEYEPSAKLIEATGGLAGVKLGPDLNGDSRPDLLAYAQDPSEFQGRESATQGEASRVIVLSGIDGTEILVTPVAEGTYYGFWEDIYLESGLLEKTIKAEMIHQRTFELEEQWEQGDRENRINEFINQSENQWNEFVARSMEEKSAELDAGSGGGDGAYLGEEQQAQMDEQWGQLEFELTQRFENSLQNEADILRSLEVDESTISSYQLTRREGFSDEIENEKTGAYEQWANEYDGPTYNREELLGEFEAELQGGRERTQQEWLDDYMVALESEKQQWMTENLGDIDNQVAEQLEQWAQEEDDDQKSWRRIDKRVVSVSPIKFPGTTGEYGLFVATGRGVSVLDISGEVIWNRVQDPNVYSAPSITEDVEKYGLGIEYESHRPVGVIDDINDDGIDDLRFLSQGSMFFATSYVSDGEINYRAGERFQGPADDGVNGDSEEIDDLNGDGVRDVALFHWVENAPPEMRILSGADGSKLLDLNGLDPNSATFKPTSDFNGDGEPDLILFQRWVESKQGPRIDILDGRTGDSIWVYNDLRDSYLLDHMGIETGINPIAPIGDLTGDGIDEVVIVRHLTWQPGASLLVIDTTNDEVLKEIFTEPRDNEHGQEDSWHPGLMVADVGDLNGDGSGEVAVVNAFGQSAENKQYRLVVIDLESESVLSDFRTIGTKLIPLDEAGLLGLVGLGGEVYTLDVFSELTVTAPPREVSAPGPVTVSWSGAPDGSFNQVIVDNVEVARTNESTVELNMSVGEHTITIRSIDPSGRGIRKSITTTIIKSSSTFTLLYLFTFVALLLTLVLPALRWWSRRSLVAGRES